MKHPHFSILAFSAVMLTGPLSPPARAASLIHTFIGGTTDGSKPEGSLTLSGSKLYGMTREGGNYGSSLSGTIFSMNTDGTGFALLHSFNGDSGRFPSGSLTLSGSKFYGMTTSGGTGVNGTIFQMNLDGSGFSLLHSFTGGVNDGYIPQAGSLTLSNSKLYGMTAFGGSSDKGTIFNMNTDGSGFSLLHSFSGGYDGGYPHSSLILSGSKFYGMTDAGGDNNRGIIFQMNLDGSGFVTLHQFSGGANDGLNPAGSLTLSGTKLYGMATGGGSSDKGTIFSMNIDGTGFGLLHSFSGGLDDGSLPEGSLTLSGAKLFGMTYDGGTNNRGVLFSLETDGSGYSLLESFGGASRNGAYPLGDVTLSADGSTLYGMTSKGGNGNNQGVVFSRPSVPDNVPEPGAFALLGSGAMLLLRRRTAPRR